MRLEDAAVGYTPEVPILRDLNLRIDRDDRIALLGQNGNGKSTFAKLIASRLELLSGHLFGAKKVSVGYFAQHQLDDLNPNETPYNVAERLMPDATEAQRRARLGAHGFGVDKADTKSANLSGGEKARLLLMITAFEGPNLLILDEPTNHLDVDSREALVRGLNEFEGAVIVISHDRHLIEATVDRLWIVDGGTVSPFDGDMDQYRRQLLEKRSNKRKAGSDAPTATGAAAGDVKTDDRAERRRLAAQRRAELAPLKKAAEKAERQVNDLSGKIEKYDTALSAPGLFEREPEKATKYATERGRLAKQLEEAEEAWLEALDAYETAAAEAADAA
jgi:ATP-binding cassette subfamily F protein 3